MQREVFVVGFNYGSEEFTTIAVFTTIALAKEVVERLSSERYVNDSWNTPIEWSESNYNDGEWYGRQSGESNACYRITPFPLNELEPGY